MNIYKNLFLILIILTVLINNSCNRFLMNEDEWVKSKTDGSSIPRNGLVGEWLFDGNANDTSGNGNNGTVNGATLTADRFGNSNKAYSFDGGNSNNNISLPEGINAGTNITFNLWVYPKTITTTVVSQEIMLFYHRAGYRDIGVVYGSPVIGQSGSKIFFTTFGTDNSGGNLLSNSDLSLNTWHQITVTYDGNLKKLYIDGVLNNSSSFNKTLNWTDNFLYNVIGCGVQESKPTFNGLIDDVRIYNRALTDEEITTLYNEGK